METQARSSRAPYISGAPRGKSLTKEERARIKAVLAPNAEDTARYKDFLKADKTGLFRLFPDYECESKNVIRADGACAEMIPGSWNYSFRRKNYSDADFLDIQFKDGNIISRSLLEQGILIKLGDVALESVTPIAAGVNHLRDFVPSDRLSEAKKQFVQLSEGVATADGYKYSNSVRAEANTTYALRAVAYRSKVKNRGFSQNYSYSDGKYINLNYGDKRIDLLVAFRIVRLDENGGITILWKELARRDAPQIVFAKQEALTDFKSNE